MKNKSNYSLFFVLVVFLGLIMFMFYQTKTNLNNINNDSNIYFYGANDEDIKNENLFDYFVENSKNELNCSLLMRIVNNNDDEHIVEYGILYEDGFYTVYSAIDGVVQTETIFDYLVSVEHDGYKYTFLSKNEDVFIEDVEEYLNGGYFNLFELNRKKAN